MHLGGNNHYMSSFYCEVIIILNADMIIVCSGFCRYTFTLLLTSSRIFVIDPLLSRNSIVWEKEDPGWAHKIIKMHYSSFRGLVKLNDLLMNHGRPNHLLILKWGMSLGDMTGWSECVLRPLPGSSVTSEVRWKLKWIKLYH